MANQSHRWLATNDEFNAFSEPFKSTSPSTAFQCFRVYLNEQQLRLSPTTVDRIPQNPIVLGIRCRRTCRLRRQRAHRRRATRLTPQRLRMTRGAPRRRSRKILNHVILRNSCEQMVRPRGGSTGARRRLLLQLLLGWRMVAGGGNESTVEGETGRRRRG